MNRQFGRDSGDMYGRHALVNPGGDNRQLDVLHFVGLPPSWFADDYVGAHRADGHVLADSGVRFIR